MEERQPEKRNDRNNRNNRNRNRNRGNRDGSPRPGGPRAEGGQAPKPGEIMAYVDEVGENAGVQENPPVVAKTDPPEGGRTESGRADAPRQERTSGRPDSNRQPNDRQRDNTQRPDRDRRGNDRQKGDPRQGGPREGDPRQVDNRDAEPRSEEDRPDVARSERTDPPRSEGGGRGEGGRQQPNQRDRDRERGRDRDQDRDRPRGDRDRGRDRGDRNREPERDRELDRPSRNEPVSTQQEWSRDDELRPSDPQPGESRLGVMKIADLAGRGADVPPEERLVVGISLGDYNGIGPEVILKALQYNQLQRVCTPVIYGSMRVLNRYRNLMNLKDWNLNGIQNVGQASHKMTNVITCWNENARPTPASETIPTPATPSEPIASAEKKEGGDEPGSAEADAQTTIDNEAQLPAVEPAPVVVPVPTVVQAEAAPQPAPFTHEIQPGKVTNEAGQAALACLERAVEDLKAGKLDALVTGPINKHNIQSETFRFPGHTEYLAEAFGVPDDLMFMVGETLRVGVVTGHVPLAKVRQHVTRNAIHQKLNMMMQSLKVDFGIEKPRIAVLGLNPHAGENGLLGTEEQETISPVIEDWRKKGELVFGPFPADGFFGTRGYRKYDAVLAMYHDQGLIPFKAIAFEEGVNFTAGLPIVRTSPDHGTAYDIAGKNLADETSMIQAIYLACDVARRRKEHKETEANALKK